ncbi:putative amidohydrolase YtcJ [Bradyrhizobium sp. USDA 3240]
MSPRTKKQTLYTNGEIIPFAHNSGEAVEALLTEGTRVVAVGSKHDVAALAAADADRTDLDGATLLPGLIDAHPHLLHYGSLHEPLVDIQNARSHEDIVARIAARAKVTPPGQWIMTTPVGEPHYFIRRSHRDLPEGDLPTREVLDRASSLHPVVIQAWAPRVPNVIAFNSLALAKLDITTQTPDRVGNVWIEKQDGNPTGRLRGSVTNYYSYDPFANDLWMKIPFLKYEYLVPGTKTAMAAYNRMGVTAVYENHMMDKPLIDAYRELRASGELRMRVMVSQEAESYGMPWSRPRSAEEFDRRLADAAQAIELEDPYFRFNGVTIMWDGTCFPGGMMMSSSYIGPYGEHTCGFHNIAPEKAERAMRFCAEHRLRLNTMCMGDQANEENLAMLERLAKQFDIVPLKWILVHSVFIRPEQIERYRRLNFDLTTSMSFCWGKGDLFREKIGDGRLGDLMPLRRFFDAGFAVAGSTDWGPKNAFEQIQLALTHEFCGSGHRNLGEGQRITREEAIGMWTWDAARVLQWQGIGRLRPGDRADLTIIDRNPLLCPVDDIAGTKVLRTVFDGSIVHDDGSLPLNA